jgi:hypothetical protein
VGVEALKFFVTGYVEKKRLDGMTDEQIQAEFKAEYQQFKDSNPNSIPDPG